MKNIASLSFLILFLFAGCTKPPDYPSEPVLEYVSMSGNAFSQTGRSSEIITVVIGYTDGDGDLGNSEGMQSLFITDLRDGSVSNTATLLPEVPAPGANNGISGEINIALQGTCCIWPQDCLQASCTPSDCYPQDTLVYEIYIEDRAGNKSNVVTLPPIYVQCN